MTLLADAGEVFVGLLVAALGFLVVVIVCAVLLAILQRVLPAPPDEAVSTALVDPAPAATGSDEQSVAP
ncbi:MAG: hypothetical protein ACR2GX_09565 [Candidatus Dormibacteria bacterium]